MSPAANVVLMGLPFVIHFFTWIHDRRQARKHGQPLPPFNPARAQQEVGDLVNTVRDAVHPPDKTPAQTPKSKGLK